MRDALRARNARAATRARSPFEQLPIAVYRARIDGAIVDVNQACADLFGWPSTADAIGCQAGTLHADPREWEVLVRDLRRSCDVRTRTVRLRRVDGVELWVELSARLVEDPSGPALVQAVARNVTEERATQARLALLASALEAAADAIVVTDTQGVIEWVNPSFTAMTGYTADEVRGRSTRLFNSGVHPADFYRDMWRTITSGRIWRGEIENRRRDGRVYAEQMSITPVRGQDGTVTHFVAVKRDVSEQRTLEAQVRQAQKMEAIGQLAGGIAHDFNNLMTAILGYCEILLSQIPASDPNHADVQEIRAAGQRASALTRQLLAFSRKQILQPTTFDIRHVVASLDKMLRRVIREDIAFTIRQADEPLHVRADVGQVEQVLINLVINASDAMPAGGQLTVSTRLVDLDQAFVRSHPGSTTGRFVALEVRDTGTGMPPEVLSRIFEPFFTTKPQGKGTGLGLSMVYGIVKQSGGYVAAESAPGAGSTFTVYLPQETTPAVEEADEPPSAKAHDGPSASILVAEDDPTIRDLVCRVLARGGFSVVAGGSAPELLRSLDLADRPPDLLLTDVVMPGTSGIELARIVRRRYPHLPVLFMSGYHDPVAVCAPGATAPERLLQKPVSPDVLLQAVHDSLGTANGAGATGRLGPETAPTWVTP